MLKDLLIFSKLVYVYCKVQLEAFKIFSNLPCSLMPLDIYLLKMGRDQHKLIAYAVLFILKAIFYRWALQIRKINDKDPNKTKNNKNILAT